MGHATPARTMTPRQRLQAALHGDVPDRVPASVWLHDFTQEHSAQALADASVHLARRFELDLLKPQMRAQCFGEMWGLEYQRSRRPDEWPLVTRHVLRSAADLAQIGTADAGRGALGEQVQAMRQVRAALGPDVPIVATVFSPMMNLTMMHRGGAPAVPVSARSSASRMGTCPGTTRDRARSRGNHAARSISGTSTRTPERGGHSSRNSLLRT